MFTLCNLCHRAGSGLTMHVSRGTRLAVASALVSGGLIGLVPGTAQAAVGTPSATLVSTTDTGAWPMTSPDRAGISYDKINKRLVISDGEVDETVNGIT